MTGKKVELKRLKSGRRVATRYENKKSEKFRRISNREVESNRGEKHDLTPGELNKKSEGREEERERRVKAVWHDSRRGRLNTWKEGHE